jgi:SAM-dependent methyltransferase
MLALAVRNWAKRSPFIVKRRRQILSLANAILHPWSVRTLAAFPVFAPASAGPAQAIAEFTVIAANQTFPFLVDLIEFTNGKRFENPTPIESMLNGSEQERAAQNIKRAFDKHGSDKAEAQNSYHYLYATVLPNLCDNADVLEIGLGTNKRNIVSTMGVTGRPGASLRAFRELLPTATIFGADIDRDILFEEPSIRTFFVDQTDLASFDSLAREIGRKFDLIIDDGLHSPNANIATLKFACENLKEGGWLVIEDIAPAALPVWRTVSALLPSNFGCAIFSYPEGLLFAVRRGGIVPAGGQDP